MVDFEDIYDSLKAIKTALITDVRDYFNDQTIDTDWIEKVDNLLVWTVELIATLKLVPEMLSTTKTEVEAQLALVIAHLNDVYNITQDMIDEASQIIRMTMNVLISLEEAFDG